MDDKEQGKKWATEHAFIETCIRCIGPIDRFRRQDQHQTILATYSP